MKLKIENLAKIEYAEIQLDGITVLAGNNDTGKSTIGKTLYSVFNSLYNLNENIEEQRKKESFAICDQVMRNIEFNKQVKGHSIRRGAVFIKIVEQLVQYLMDADEENINKEFYREQFAVAFAKYHVMIDEKDLFELTEETYEKVMMRINKDSHAIAVEIVERYFLWIFNSQIQCINNKDKTAEISLLIKNSDVKLEFQDNQCSYLKADCNIAQEAFFIDDPFILDDIPTEIYIPDLKIREQLKKRILGNGELMSGIFESINAKEKLEVILKKLNMVAAGTIVFQNGQWSLKERQYQEPLNLNNLSAGLKSFLLIKLLLEKAILKEKDVLILDEPEIHLHPEWQMRYAEIVVLLQKEFDLNIVVTTHSMDFLEAVDYYSQKYKVAEKCNYYLAVKNCNQRVTFHNVTENLDEIYAQMVSSSMLLDRLKYEMENDGEE